jgi:ABC-2 type transport system ATP-binding protein
VQSLSHEESYQTWRLDLHDNSDVDTAANNIAHCVVEAGGRLFQLNPEVRNLHTVFREVSSEEVTPDA